MSYEIEFKAHVSEDRVDSLVSYLKQNSSKFFGEIDKKDLNWAKVGDTEPILRTRLEKTDAGSKILFTSKPSKTKKDGVEYNIENEFMTDISQWNDIEKFLKGIGLDVCRRKFKSGYHCIVNRNGFDIHCEILNVKYLGWFVESEIIVKDDYNTGDRSAENVLFDFYKELNISKSDIEPTGYNKLLLAVGHELG